MSLFLVLNLAAQENFPKNDFRSPLDIPLFLSGTFGEPRNTHFHAGLDLKTEGVEGKNIYAIADGYVSRIRVSGWGYGNALYITHPNGYTSVYAHLSEFDEKITKWIKVQQEAQTSFTLDMMSLDPKLFPVKQSQIVAKSGNTGGSQGPHVHFEIRDSLGKAINPFLFGFDSHIQDNVKPSLFNLVAYNLSSKRYFSNSKSLRLQGSGGNYSITETLKINKGAVGFGVNTIDKFDHVSNNNGVYDIKMYLDGELVYNYQMNHFAPDEGRYVYTHCDYWRKVNYSQNIHKCFVEPGNKLQTYSFLKNNGYIFLEDYEVHTIKIEVSDFHKNKSTLSYSVQRDDKSEFFKETEMSFQDILVQGKANLYQNDDLFLNVPKDGLFDDLYLEIKKEVRDSYSDGFHIGDVQRPIFSPISLSLKTKNLNESLIDKYLMVFKNYRKAVRAIGGAFNEETKCIDAKARGFGYFYVSIDTIPPRISSLSVWPGKTMTNYKAFQFRISDNLSGIDSYDCFINGKWAVLEVDGKNALYTYYVDEKVVKGKNEILVIVKDERNNASTFRAEFVY